MAGRGGEGLFLRCLKPLDERVNVKLLLRVWGPRFELFVRLLLVATFLDDSFRAAMHFSEHVKQIGEQGCMQGLAETQPELVGAVATVALGAGLLAQSLGSLCLLALVAPDGATKALIVWAVAQPVLYAQLANAQFVAESLSLVGGLLILRAHLSEQLRSSSRFSCSAIARTQLLGRLLLPTVYLHRARHVFRAEHSLPRHVVDLALLVAIVLGCGLVAAGLKSRTVALSLALANVALVFYQHPFFRFVSREGGEWKYDEPAMRKAMPPVSLPSDVSTADFEPWHLFDLHRYYFFEGLSTSGALLLLAQFGPGEIAVEEDEELLGDVQKARDGYARVAATV